MDETGKSYSSLEFSNKMMQWEESCKNLYFFIGGPDGNQKRFLKCQVTYCQCQILHSHISWQRLYLWSKYIDQNAL